MAEIKPIEGPYPEKRRGKVGVPVVPKYPGRSGVEIRTEMDEKSLGGDFRPHWGRDGFRSGAPRKGLVPDWDQAAHGKGWSPPT
jgi:hypothetical protein